MKASVIIGSAYGDEGKSLFTDYLASQLNYSTVIRFNGGAQAGHTVTTDSLRHVFGHFSSNSLLGKGHDTYLSKYFVVNPLVFQKEKLELEAKGLNPYVVIHNEAFVTTPYDMILNQLVEKKRGEDKHGSCGLGFGETIERCEREGFCLQFKDLKNMVRLSLKLGFIRDNYIKIRAKELNILNDIMTPEYNFIFSDDLIEKFVWDVQNIFKHVLGISSLPSDENIIFEGAQGLLLDQDLGCFPYVTRSNTGLKNVIELIEGTNINELDVIYATRCYTTRHGAGPLSNELSKKPYINIIDNTNIHNEYQGTLRFAYLDIDLLKETIIRDKEKANIPKNIKVNIKIGISCLDQTETVYYYENNKLNSLPTTDFIEKMKIKFNCDLLLSFGTTRDTIKYDSFECIQYCLN